MQSGAQAVGQPRLEALLHDLSAQLIDGQRRVEEALHEIARGARHSIEGEPEQPARGKRMRSWDESQEEQEEQEQPLPILIGLGTESQDCVYHSQRSRSLSPSHSRVSRSLSPSHSRVGVAMDMIENDQVHSHDLRRMFRSVVQPSRSESKLGYIASRISGARTSTFVATPSPTRLRARAMVDSVPYEVGVMLLILANTIFIAWQTQHQASRGKPLPWQLEAQVAFCLVFVLDLSFRAYAMALDFLFGDCSGWNVFDSILIALMLVETIEMVRCHADPTFEAGLLPHASTVRALRVLRVVRLLRASRYPGLFSQLRIMIRSIMHSVKPLAWASVVLAFMFFLFGMTLTQGTADYLQEQGVWHEESSSKLRFRFGSIQRSALSLFQVMSGGLDWGPLYDILEPVGFQFQFVLLFFVLFAIFGAANVMTGIFVEIANEWTQNDREMQVQGELDKKLVYIQAIQDLFSELDLGCAGVLTLENFQRIIDDKRLLNSFAALELELMDVKSLFLLLDRDQKGFIDVEEFLLGCLRLKGDARQLDVVKLQYQSEWIMHNMANMQDMVSALSSKLGTHDATHNPASLRSSAVASIAGRCMEDSEPQTPMSQSASCWIKEASQTTSARQWQAALTRRRARRDSEARSVGIGSAYGSMGSGSASLCSMCSKSLGVR